MSVSIGLVKQSRGLALFPSQLELLETLDRPALKALPNLPYVYAQWQRARVAPDYHIEVAGHFYSVPSRLIREIVEVRITAETVEIFHTGKRIASHARSHLRNRHTTTTAERCRALRRALSSQRKRLTLESRHTVRPRRIAGCAWPR